MKNKNKSIKEERNSDQTFLILSRLFNLPKKCEWCGCYDGIHRSNCRLFLMIR